MGIHVPRERESDRPMLGPLVPTNSDVFDEAFLPAEFFNSISHCCNFPKRLRVSCQLPPEPGRDMVPGHFPGFRAAAMNNTPARKCIDFLWEIRNCSKASPARRIVIKREVMVAPIAHLPLTKHRLQLGGAPLPQPVQNPTRLPLEKRASHARNSESILQILHGGSRTLLTGNPRDHATCSR